MMSPKKMSGRAASTRRRKSTRRPPRSGILAPIGRRRPRLYPSESGRQQAGFARAREQLGRDHVRAPKPRAPHRVVVAAPRRQVVEQDDSTRREQPDDALRVLVRLLLLGGVEEDEIEGRLARQ